MTTCETIFATTSDGYRMQDLTENGDPATTKGIFVYRSNGPGGIQVGDVVRQTAEVLTNCSCATFSAASNITHLLELSCQNTFGPPNTGGFSVL